MSSRLLAAGALLAMAVSLQAQSAGITVNSVSLAISPAGTDSYSIQGTFSGLTAGDTSYLTFAVGNFTASLPLSSFSGVPGSTWTYRDSTGQAPGWVSSLTIDWSAGTFSAQAKGIVLAGLTNPFAVRLAAERSSLCTMVRVQQTGAGNYQLTSSDPAGMTCELAGIPLATPKVAIAGTATAVTVDVSPLALTANDTPKNVQLFQADDNGQPMGSALCTLTAQADGDYACTVTVNQAASGAIPLLVEATVGGNAVLSPGFAVEVAEPATAADLSQLSAIETVALQAWQNISQNGDTAYARTLTLMSLRKLLAPPVELTALPFGLAADGSSIYVRTAWGVPVNIPLANAADLNSSASLQPAVSARGSMATAQAVPAPMPAPPAEPAEPGREAEPAEEPMCPSATRDIVWSDQVLVWAPSTLWGFTHQNDLANVLASSTCPFFSGTIAQLDGSAATVASLKTFVNYGTVVVETQGGEDDQGYYFVSGDTCPSCSQSALSSMAGVAGIACINACYIAVYPNNRNLQPLTSSSILYAGFHYSLQGKSGFRKAFVPDGSTNAYFGYYYTKASTDDARFGVPLMVLLVQQYKDAGDSYLKVKRIAPALSFSVCSGSKPVLGNCAAKTQAALKKEPYFQFQGDENVAYVGNPTLEMSELNPPVNGSQGLAAFMEGAASCGPHGGNYLNVSWSNPAKAGHLTPLTGNVTGQDSFTEPASDPPPADASGTLVSSAAFAKYTPDALLTGTSDTITTMFATPAGKNIAKACLTIGGNAGLFVESYLNTTYNGGNPEGTSMVAINLHPPMKVTGTYTAPLTDPNNYAAQGASSGVNVTSNGGGRYTVVLTVGGAAPGGGAGPYQGTANIDLSAVNPGVEGQAKVTISGSFDANTIAELQQCASQPTCSFPDGSIYIEGPNTNTSVALGTPGTVPFTVSADSSTGPVDIFVGMNANAEAKTPAKFTITLNITFTNQ